MKYTDLKSPSPTYIHNISPLPRKTASLITQLQSGHIPLNKYLFRIGKSTTTTCPACNQANKTVLHYLLHCPAYYSHRQALRFETGGNTIAIGRLLNKPNHLKAVARYVTKTRRFNRPEDNQRDVPTPTTQTVN